MNLRVAFQSLITSNERSLAIAYGDLKFGISYQDLHMIIEIKFIICVIVHIVSC